MKMTCFSITKGCALHISSCSSSLYFRSFSPFVISTYIFEFNLTFLPPSVKSAKSAFGPDAIGRPAVDHADISLPPSLPLRIYGGEKNRCLGYILKYCLNFGCMYAFAH